MSQSAESAALAAAGVRARVAPARRRRGWLVRRALLAADVLGLTAAFLVAEAVFESAPAQAVGLQWEAVGFYLIAIPSWIVAAKLAGLYDRDEERASHVTTDDLGGVFRVSTLGVWLVVALTNAFDALPAPDLTKTTAFWALAILLVTVARAGARVLCRRSPSYRQPTVIVGAGRVGQLIARKVLQHREYGIELLGFVDGDPLPRDSDVEEVPLLGRPEELPELVRSLHVERVIVAFSRDSREKMLEIVRAVHQQDVQVDMVPRFFEVIGSRVDLHEVEGLGLLGLPPLRLSRSSRLLKRALDLVVAGLALVVAMPLLLVAALAIRLESPGPILFRQVRMGSAGRTFLILKLRTMDADADARKAEVAHLNKHRSLDARMFKVPADPRITRVGRVLRRFSIDELPQLVNVLRGEMSLVGPRPLILEEDRHIEDWARRRLDLKPGLTGLWQVLGRSDIPFEEMLRLDYLYVTSWSLWGDVRLLLRTVPALVGRTGGAY